MRAICRLVAAADRLGGDELGRAVIAVESSLLDGVEARQAWVRVGLIGRAAVGPAARQSLDRKSGQRYSHPPDRAGARRNRPGELGGWFQRTTRKETAMRAVGVRFADKGRESTYELLVR